MTQTPEPVGGPTASGPVGWEQIRDRIMLRIQTLDWSPGQKIPNEQELAQIYGCSRATMNRALQALAENGVLERRRRAGTRVAALPVRHARLRIPIVREEVEASGCAYGYRLLSCATEPLPPEVAKIFDHTGAGLHVLAAHLSDQRVFVLEDRWINTKAIPTAATVDFSRISANEWLVANAPISTGTISFAPHQLTAPEALVMQLEPGALVLQAERTTWHSDGAITTVRQLFWPDYKVTLRI